MNRLFLIFETRGIRSSELDKLIKINGFAQAIKGTSRIEVVVPRSSCFDSGKYLPDVDLSDIQQVIVLGSTYSEILMAALMKLSDSEVEVLVMPELLALLDADGRGLPSSSITTLLGSNCFANMDDFISR